MQAVLKAGHFSCIAVARHHHRRKPRSPNNAQSNRMTSASLPKITNSVVRVKAGGKDIYRGRATGKGRSSGA